MNRFFAVILCLCMLPLGGMATEESITLPLTFGGSAEIPFSSDALLFPASALEYSHDLCKLTLQMAVSSFGMQGEAPDASVLRFLKGLGFENVVTEEYDYSSPDTIGSAIGMQTKDGRPLVAIVIRSSNYGQEWVSNFDSSILDGHHQGFYLSAQKVVNRVQDYLSLHEIHEKPIVWITGYSRGAAVANIVAALISEKSISDDEMIYAYTFATPATVQAEQSKKHFNIFNILQYGDIVTHVPLKGWGFERYGTSLYLPTSASNADLENFLPAYQETYRNLTGQEDEFANDAANVEAVEKVVAVMLKTVPTTQAYHATYETLFKKAMLGETFDTLDMTLAGLLLSNVLAALDPENSENYMLSANLTNMNMEEVIALLLPCAIKHMPESYMAALYALPDEKALFGNSLSILP